MIFETNYCSTQLYILSVTQITEISGQTLTHLHVMEVKIIFIIQYCCPHYIFSAFYLNRIYEARLKYW